MSKSLRRTVRVQIGLPVSIAFLALLVVASLPVGAGASTTLELHLQRIGAIANANLDNDGKDDVRVDAGIAIFDTGVDLDHPSINLVAAVDCTGATLENEYACDESAGVGDDTSGHGTKTAIDAAAIDGVSGSAGVAPGARIFAVRDADGTIWKSQAEREEAKKEYEECLRAGGKEAECAEEASFPWDLAPAIAATKWVTAHAEEIDVAVGAPGRACALEPTPGVIVCLNEQQLAEYRAAIEEMVDAGVVYVDGALPYETNVAASVNGSMPEDAIVTSAMADGDGLPGGRYEGDPCPFDQHYEDEDDTLWDQSGWGENVAIAAPACALSDAIPQVAGAAALLASADHPESREDVEAIRDAIVGDSVCPNDVGAGNCDWTDDSGDGFKEPLLDVSDEEVFDPAMLPGCAASSAPEVESDVDGDGHADLVTMHPDGSVTVHGGGAGYQFATGVDSFSGQGALTPALFIGSGDHVIDVADVGGDGCADLITMTSEGDAVVYPGRPDRSFGFPVTSLEGSFEPALLKAGGDEPIAAADVTGDGNADLVVYDDVSQKLTVHPGAEDGTFATGVTTSSTVYSALHTASGEYFADVADVTGDGRSDLVSINTWRDLYVRAGNADGTFAAPVSSQWGNINPSLDDGSGREPLGVADVTGDGKADLVLGEAGKAYVYPAQSGADLGRFGTPRSSLPGATPFTTFGASTGSEVAGVFDVNADGRADVIAAHTNGRVYVAKGETDGSFSTTTASFDEGFFKSTQHFQNQNADGSELVTEKPSLRRRGCASNGCHYTTASATLASGFGTTGRNGSYSIYPSEADGDLLQRFWHPETGWSGWGWHGSPSGGQATTASAATSPQGADYVFVRGADGALWEKHWTDASGRWSGWSSLGSALATSPGPAAVSRESDKMDVFARAASDSSVIRRSWTSTSGWGSWETVSGTRGTTGVATSSRPGSSSIDLFMRDAEGDVTQRWWTASNGWSEQGWHDSPPGGAATSAPAVVSLASSVHVFIRGADRGIWEKVWTDASGRWSDWTPLGGVLRSGPSATSPASGEVHVFARAANDSFWRKRWSEEEGWSEWEPVY